MITEVYVNGEPVTNDEALDAVCDGIHSGKLVDAQCDCTKHSRQPWDPIVGCMKCQEGKMTKIGYSNCRCEYCGGTVMKDGVCSVCGAIHHGVRREWMMKEYPNYTDLIKSKPDSGHGAGE